jgi:multicomponent Na+:H+ antiporter subunit G
MLDFIQILVSYTTIAAGVFIILSGSIGMIRFPDVFTRLHAAGVVDSLGCPLVLLGLIVIEGFTIVALKLFLLLIVMLLTSPTACYALAKAAYLASGLKLEEKKD